MTESFFNYLEYEKRYSPHTLTSYRNDITQFCHFLNEVYGSASLTEVNHHIVRSWIFKLAEDGISARTVNRKLASLRALFKFLLKKDSIKKDPTSKIKAPKIKKSLPAFVPEDDLAKLLDQFTYSDDFSGLRDKVIIELLYGTGIRLSELIGLRDPDINLFEQTIKVRGKGNKERLIPLNKSLTKLITIYKGQKELSEGNSDRSFIVTDKGEPCYPMFIYRTVKKYLDMATIIEKRSPHVLRHTFATHLLNRGADLNAIKDLLGHSSLAATQVYTHNSLDKIKAIFDQAHPKA